MKKVISFCFGMLLLISFYACANAIQVSGDIWGTWDPSNNPYEVVGDLRVPHDSSLTILPGCSIQFQGHYYLKVDSLARMIVIGTAQDSIYFFPIDTVEGWAGIRFDYADIISKISYCSFKYRIWLPQDSIYVGAIYIKDGSLQVTNCGFKNNYRDTHWAGGAIWAGISDSLTLINNCHFINNGCCDTLSGFGPLIVIGSGTISDCIFEQNKGCPIYCSGKAKINNNIFRNNRGPQIYGMYCTIEINNNLFYNNRDDINPGVVCGDTYAKLTNNIFCNNLCLDPDNEYSGVFMAGCDYPRDIQLVNNIFWGDSLTPQINSAYCQIFADYNDIRGGWPGTGNIDSDPMFVDTANGDFHLQAGSPCIDAGDPSSPFDPDWSRADMGALPFNHTFSIYLPGDISGDGQRLGADVTYGVRYFKGWNAPPPDSVYNDSTGTWVYAAADVNGDCEFLGADITYLVGYYKGINPILKWCPQTPPY